MDLPGKLANVFTANLAVTSSLTIGSLSSYDGDANENLTQKTNFIFLKLLRYYPN